MRSPRHTAVSRRAVSRASSSCARTSRRDATGCRLTTSRDPLPRLILEKTSCFRNSRTSKHPRRPGALHLDLDQGARAANAILLRHVHRRSCHAPVPRLPGAHEAREDDAFGRAAGNLRVLLLTLQAGGNQDARAESGVSAGQFGLRMFGGTSRRLRSPQNSEQFCRWLPRQAQRAVRWNHSGFGRAGGVYAGRETPQGEAPRVHHAARRGGRCRRANNRAQQMQ